MVIMKRCGGIHLKQKIQFKILDSHHEKVWSQSFKAHHAVSWKKLSLGGIYE